MRLHCVPLPAPGPPRTKTTLGPKSTCLRKVRFLELHRFADKDDSCPKGIGVSIWGFERKAEAQSGCKNPTLLTLLNCVAGEIQLSMILRAMDWRREWTRPGEHQSGKFRKPLHPTQQTLSHSCIHGLPAHPSKLHPHAALHQSCGKRKRACFLVSVKKNKSQDKLFFREGKEIVDIENRSLENTVQKKGCKKFKKTSLGTKQNNHQPKKIGKAFTPSHATLLLKCSTTGMDSWQVLWANRVLWIGFPWFSLLSKLTYCTVCMKVKMEFISQCDLPANQWPPARSHIL